MGFYVKVWPYIESFDSDEWKGGMMVSMIGLVMTT